MVPTFPPVSFRRHARTAAATLLIGLLAHTAASAAAGDGAYPIDDPLAATVVGTPKAYRASLPTDLPRESRTLAPLVERPVPSPLAYAVPLEYGLIAQDEPAPLMFILAGTGAGAKSAKSDVIARALYTEGYHVVTLPSPTSVGFMLGAATHPVPGRMNNDVADIYRFMQAVRDDLPERVRITGFSLTGYSLGGLQAAFVDQRDRQEQVFGFERVLLINPAVDLYASVRRMDRLFDTGLEQGIAGLPAFLEQALGRFRQIYAGEDPIEFNEDFLYQAYLATETREQDIAAIIGLAFRLWLANMNFAADLLSNSGVIVPVAREPGTFTSLDTYLVRSFGMSFADYIDELLLPYYNKDGRQLTRDALIREGRLARIQPYLKRAGHMGVITSADEIILDRGEVDFLRRTFGERATIFPHGGHMGNLAHRDVIGAIREFFRP
ncbi:hypothetical protein [Spectribacter hydrogenoxidans]|uniref:AB hydrolase-1 domain-containing protein n=1 Tax=Spectribacter hydrogenoxidans TaxID=3075608 RepID=A0ABU3C1B3_9GAMM|nr:hypothetical protein [Salinisphaera sp. W335]MDT0635334.1 hypothetical protein [Salinisphaera sp. W335]